MLQLLALTVKKSITLFVLVGPVSMIPVFLAAVAGFDLKEKQKFARLLGFSVSVALLVATFLGEAFLGLMGVRALLKALKRGEAVGMLPDQAPKVGEGRWLDFFGKPAYTMTLAARLSETGCTVLMVWAERLPRGAGYHFHVQEPTQPLCGSTEERAQMINHEIETLIRQCPQQYLWAYNRYKRPRGAEPPPD